MSLKNLWRRLFALVVICALLLTACAPVPVQPPAPTPATQPEAAAPPPATATPVPAAAAGGEVKNPDTYTQLLSGDVATLDPQWQFDGASNQVAMKIYEKLINFKGDSLTEYEPVLATEIPTEQNGLITSGADGSTVIAFPIREKVKFHNGDVLTPEDVKYTLMRMVIQDRAGGGAYALMPALTGGPSHIEDLAKSIAGVKEFKDVDDASLIKTFEALDKTIVVNGNKVEFHLPKPYAPFMSMLAGSWPDRVINQKWAIALGDWPGTAETWKQFHDPTAADSKLYDKVNGTGPFKLVSWDRTNKEVVLERFDDYWGGQPPLKKVIIRQVPEWSTRKLMLEAGDADQVDADYSVLSQLEGMEGVRVQKGLPTLYKRALHFQWNVGGENNPALGSGQLDGQGIPADFFSDVNVRKAFSYAYNYAVYLEQVWNNEAQQAIGPIGEGGLGYQPEPRYSYDPSQAAEFFKKAFDGKLWDAGFKFTAYTPDRYGDIGKTGLEILREELLNINPKFQMEIETVQWSNFLGRVFGDQGMPLYVLYMGLDYPDSDNAVSLYMASDYLMGTVQGATFTELCKKEFDPLIAEARNTFDEASRAQIYSQLQKMAYDYAIDIFTDAGVIGLVTRDWVQGIVWNPSGVNSSLSFADVSKGY